MQKLKEIFLKKSCSKSSVSLIQDGRSKSLPKKKSIKKEDDEFNFLSTPVSCRQVRSASCGNIEFGKLEINQLNSQVSDDMCESKVFTELLPLSPVTKSSRSESGFDLVSDKKPGSPNSKILSLEIPKWKLFIRRSSSQNSGKTCPAFDKCVHCLLLSKKCEDDCQLKSPLVSSQESEGEESEFDQSESEEDGGDSLEVSDSLSYDNEEGLKEKVDDQLDKGFASDDCGLPLVTISAAPIIDSMSDSLEEDLGSGITVVSLEVPITKKNRSCSIDASFLKVPQKLLINTESDENEEETLPTKTQRSHSVDISFPTNPDAPYLVVPKFHSSQIFLK